jgi:hypothetical protein
MLYDNAQLARVCLHAWILTARRSKAVTGNESFRIITEETLDYVAGEMLDPAGGLYSTQDAGSEGEESKFCVWTGGEIRCAPADKARTFMAAYRVKPGAGCQGHCLRRR